MQALASLEYSRRLIGNELIASALATAGRERDPIVIAQHTLVTLSDNKSVRSMGDGCREGLKAGLLGNPSLTNFARSDASGMARCSVLPFKSPLSFAGEKWWQRGIRTQGFTLSAPVVGKISKQNVLIGMLPVQALDGSNDGAITVAINIAWLQKSLSRAAKSLDATIAVTDAGGRVILLNGDARLPRLNVAPAVGRIAEATSQDGIDWIYSAAPLYEDSLYIIYAERRSVVMATAREQVKIGLILPIVAILLASLALWLGTNAIVVRWLTSLRTLTAQFGAGQYGGAPDHYANAPREISELSNELHAMARTIESRDDDLQTALATKSTLTMEIHHRVKNNLQIVSSLLNLQARRIDDPAARAALSQTRVRIGALAQIHRLLYEDANEAEHGAVDVGRLMTDLCAQLRSYHRQQSNIELVCQTEICSLPVDHAVPISLFAVEAITNAICHAFPDHREGTITVSLSIQNGEVLLRIHDNGIGYSTTDGQTMMGRQLMDAFATQLDGVLTIASNMGVGTTVSLAYRIAA